MNKVRKCDKCGIEMDQLFDNEPAPNHSIEWQLTLKVNVGNDNFAKRPFLFCSKHCLKDYLSKEL